MLINKIIKLYCKRKEFNIKDKSQPICIISKRKLYYLRCNHLKRIKLKSYQKEKKINNNK